MSLDQVDVDKEEARMSFLQHLDVLRKHLIRSSIVASVLSIVSLVFCRRIFDDIILASMKPEFWTYRKICELSTAITGNDSFCLEELNLQLQSIRPVEQFAQFMKIGLVAGLIVSFPYILFELWLFIKPGLKSKERKRSRGIIAVISLLFFTGVLFGYYILTPITVNFFDKFSMSDLIQNIWTLDSVISLVVSLSAGTGLIFQTPVLIYFLAKVGLISVSVLKKYRRHALLVVLILSAIVTPPDIISQLILTLPVYLLYELGLRVAQRVEKAED